MTDNETQFLFKKIESIEMRLESHVGIIEKRLDQLVSIMQAVAQLQEKESRNAEAIKDLKLQIQERDLKNSEAIKEVKEQLKQAYEKFEKISNRIHERLDKVDNALNKELFTCKTDCKKEYDILEEKITLVDAKIDKWTNRGIGLWVGISALVVVLQTLGGLILSSYKDEYVQIKTTVSELVKKQNEIDNFNKQNK